MSIQNFYQKYGAKRKPIAGVLDQWNEEKVTDDLNTLITAGILTADGAIGDGLTDRISTDLHTGMSELMKDIESYGDARAYLRATLEKGDESIRGTISKIKGQIAENHFIEASGANARLAASGSQEGWDVAVDHGDWIQYVQVKAYANPDRIISKMLEVHEKTTSGVIFDNEDVVTNIDFAVPYDIIELVREKASQYPQLANAEVIPLDITAAEAGAIVQDGLNNLGPEALSHLFGELMAGTATAAMIFSMINAVKVMRGDMVAGEAVATTLGDTAIAGAAYSIGLLSEVALDRVLDTLLAPASVGIGIAARIAIKRSVSSRMDANSAIVLSNVEMQQRIELLQAL